ncbi:putative SOS response-associated peptidase YedK [Jejuia pallidilutea]|uniref:Abasic site processing protein n=1 Tax=Jejuia pallidilutea TaxID=504487 RepID=A0A362X6Y2_9FLAO|nr:SOS response-associated peptidase family protein [Jejuia pallidilutea]PQV51223.1 putative SOS response-associated peptidase YedK [Jejuia pallidilutea]
MCYHTSQKKQNRETIKNDFGVNKIDSDFIPTYYHVNGFQRPQMMVITEQEPEKIQLATWSIAPPNSEDMVGYWKKTGGGCINTRIESLFESKTPYWKKDAILGNKCVFIIDGMFKVYTASNKNKIPMLVRRPNDELFGVLGYYTEQGGILTASMLTTDSDDFIGQFHKRMTFAFEPQDVEYFFKLNSEEDFKNEIQAHKTRGFEYYSVSHDVINSHKESNRPDIVSKVEYPELNTLF